MASFFNFGPFGLSTKDPHTIMLYAWFGSFIVHCRHLCIPLLAAGLNIETFYLVTRIKDLVVLTYIC